jgi:hypothetical protein
MPASSYTYTRFGGSGWTQTIYSALMRRMAIHFAFTATKLARVAGIEPASSGFGGRRSTSLNFTLIVKEQQKTRR